MQLKNKKGDFKMLLNSFYFYRSLDIRMFLQLGVLKMYMTCHLSKCAQCEIRLILIAYIWNIYWY